MATVTDAIIQAVIDVTNAAVQVIMVERGDEITGHRNEAADMRPKIGRTSSTFDSTKEVRTSAKLIM